MTIKLFHSECEAARFCKLEVVTCLGILFMAATSTHIELNGLAYYSLSLLVAQSRCPKNSTDSLSDFHLHTTLTVFKEDLISRLCMVCKARDVRVCCLALEAPEKLVMPTSVAVT